jgi:hypothetical protein
MSPEIFESLHIPPDLCEDRHKNIGHRDFYYYWPLQQTDQQLEADFFSGDIPFLFSITIMLFWLHA